MKMCGTAIAKDRAEIFKKKRIVVIPQGNSDGDNFEKEMQYYM